MTPFLPGETDHHLVKALRFCSTMSSTSGTSASGQGPVAPLGPLSGPDHEYELSLSVAVAVLAGRTTSWKPSYSLRAAEMTAEPAAGSGSDGRILVVPSVTRTVAARVTEASRKSAVNVNRVEVGMCSPDGSARQGPRGPWGRPSLV